MTSLSARGKDSTVTQTTPAVGAVRPGQSVEQTSSNETLTRAIGAAREALLAMQRDDGHWVGELQGDTILESEYVLLLTFLGRADDPRVRKACNYLLQQALPEGGWSNYPGGPADVSVSVKAYFALKIAGHQADEPVMQRARAVIRRLGGAAKCNSFTKFYLALLGQTPYSNCPCVPPELVLLPRWAYINIYAMSAWTRTILVPLSIVSAYKPIRTLPAEQGIAELFLDSPQAHVWPHEPTRQWFSWTNFFLGVDVLLKWCERAKLTFCRQRALRKAVAWMRQHYENSDGIGAIFPPMVYNVIALKCLGVPEDDPEFEWAMSQFDALMIEEGDTLRLQPCLSPVWDTALSLIGLCDANLGGGSRYWQDEPARRASQWLIQREIRRQGDWSLANPKQEPGGWAFEYNNGFYPDTDDTAMVLLALARSGAAVTEAGRGPVHRGLNWLLAMQNRDGGWAAFDRDINRQVLERVPFADHNAMLDPSCPDITARVLEALGHYGARCGQEPVERALRFLERTQTSFGAWQGRWGVNYIYGTWQVLVGLKAVGYDMHSPMVRRAVDWLEQVQQPCGGWGESCASYDEVALAGKGTPTASQTAWAVLGLLAAGRVHSEAVRRGVRYLCQTQRLDGTWAEEPFTGTGFPRVFYLKYHLYPLYFPLMALARYQHACREALPSPRAVADPAPQAASAR
jgi:squalene-hopene/tetraprenyl-beta-curcumene cyclase